MLSKRGMLVVLVGSIVALVVVGNWQSIGVAQARPPAHEPLLASPPGIKLGLIRSVAPMGLRRAAEGAGMVPLQPPVIEFTKTVGTDPIGCAITKEIHVLPGTNVNYCYDILNTGPITVTFHTIEDDQLGTVLGPDFPFVLEPGARVTYPVSTLITQNTVNRATWTAKTSGLVPAVDTDLAAVWVIIFEVPVPVHLPMVAKNWSP